MSNQPPLAIAQALAALEEGHVNTAMAHLRGFIEENTHTAFAIARRSAHPSLLPALDAAEQAYSTADECLVGGIIALASTPQPEDRQGPAVELARDVCGLVAFALKRRRDFFVQLAAATNGGDA